MSSSESSYNAGQDSFCCQEYEIEDESDETTSKNVRVTFHTVLTVEDEFIDKSDEFNYTDEPPADDS